MYISNAKAHVQKAVAALNEIDTQIPAGSSDTARYVVRASSGDVIINEDGTVTFSPSHELIKSIREAHKSVERGYSLMAGGAGLPCPSCGGSGKV